eukprot:Opistho-2@73004
MASAAQTEEPAIGGGQAYARRMSVADDVLVSKCVVSTLTQPIDGYMIAQDFGIVVGSAVGCRDKVSFTLRGELEAIALSSTQVRNTATQLMIREAVNKGANAVLGVHYDIETIGTSGSGQLVTAYGTACTIVPLQVGRDGCAGGTKAVPRRVGIGEGAFGAAEE